MRSSVKWAIPVIVLFLLHFSLPSIAGNSKLYIATNKENYSLSEFIQFQVFLLNAPNTNNTLYVELLDCKGNKYSKKMLPLTSGISWGNIELPQTGDAEFFLLYCYIINKDTVEIDCSKKIFINNSPAGNKNAQPMIDLFTEGGGLVSELENNILISCKDENGNPLSTKGKITDAKNNIISRFTTDETGYAKLSFNPEFKKNYFIVAETKQASEIKKDIPPASQYGVNLTATVHDDSLTYRVFSYTGDKDQLDYKLDILSNGKTIYKADINFQPGLSFIGETLALKDLGAGFLTLKLTDLKNRSYAQRIMYNDIDSRNNSFIRIVDTVNKKTAVAAIPAYANGYAYLNILLNDQVAATENKMNRLTLKDQIEQPVIINTESKEISFNDFLISYEKPPFEQAAEQLNNSQFLKLSGTVYNFENKPIKNKKINLIFVHKDLKKDYQVVTCDRNGKFEVNSFIFYDTVTVYYQLADNSDEKNSIFIDMKVTPDGSFSGNELRSINFICAAQSAAQPVAPDTSVNNKMNTNVINDITFKDAKTLTAVNIKGEKQKLKTNSEKFIEQNVSGQHNQAAFKDDEFDFIANPQVIDNTPIFSFLRGRFNLVITISANGNITMSTTAGEGIGVYVNDMDLTDNLDRVSTLLVYELALVRYYSFPLKPRMSSTKTKFGASSGTGGDLMIYTRNGFTETEQKVKGLAKTRIVGYDPDMPVSAAPVATGYPQSLYWKPNWTAKKEEIIYIGLPANSSEKNVQLIIEGINTASEPFSLKKNLVFN